MVAERQVIRAPLRALLVEDSEDDALLLLRELRRGGYEPEYERVDTPEGMREALDGSPPWDVIFSDYNMPRFGAPEALAMAREAAPQTPFIVVSGKVGEDAAVATLKAGAYDYVMKGNLARLCATVKRGMQEAEERRERRRAERELGRRDAILDAVRFAADSFLVEASGWEESVRAVLRRLGEATGVSRVYVFENHAGPDGGLWNVQRYKWLAPGVSPGLPAGPDGSALTDFPYRDDGAGRWADFGSWEETLGRGEPIYGNTRDFPESERTFLAEALGILSMVLVPIFVEGRWWGFIGFDDCLEEREWSAAEVGALGAAAGTLGAAIRRKQVEEQLRGSEERYRAVIDQATDGIYLLDAGARRLLQTNPSFRAMLGYAAGEMDGMQVYDFVAHPRENVDATIERTLKERRRIVGERKYRKKDGTLVDVEVGVSVISLGGREVICTIVRDVTERKRTEEKIKASEAELRALFGAMDDPIFVLDGEGRHLKVAPTNPPSLYKPPAEIIGKTLHELFPAEQADEFLGYVRQALETRRRLNFEYGLTIDRRQMWFEGTVSPMLEDSVVWVARDVTERKKNEVALRESEERFRSAFESAAIGMGLVGLDGRWLKVNRPLCDLVGYPEREMLELTFQDITHPDDLEGDLRQVGQALRGEIRAYQMEKRYLHKDGHVVWILLSVSLVRNDDGSPLYFISQVQDITQRKRAEEALARSEDRLRTIVETEPECVKVLGMDGSLLEMNPAGLSMIEADSLEQVRGRSVYGYIAPEHRAAFVALTERVLRGGSGTLEFELFGLKGTRRWLETHAVPLRDARGGISGLLGITRDVTERKKNEEELRQSERLYRAVIEQATENIFLVDVETRRIVESNPAFQETLGYSEEELRRMTLYDVVAADRESIDANVRLVVEQNNPSVGERRYRRKDGSLLDVEVSASTILLDGRETLCAVAHDVTERARLQALLEERVAILARISADVTLDLPMRSTLNVLAESVVRASTAVACSVSLIDEATGFLRIEGSHGLPEGFERGIEAVWRDVSVRSPTLEAIAARRPVLAESMRRRMLENPFYAPVHDSVREAEWDTVFIVPLVSRGRSLGALHFNYLHGEQPGEDERVFLSAVTDQAAVAVENVRLFSEARGKAALEERRSVSRASCTTPSPRRSTASRWAPGPPARCWIAPPSRSPTRSTTSSPWPTRASPRCAP